MELSDSEKMKQLDGFKVYPSLRDHPLKTAAQWLEGRRLDDRLGGMWRVHDHLYDLSDFIHKHPGGAEWLEMTRGTDITEAFESSHINPSINKLLDKYRVGPADTERISPFTFHPEGFYSVLKRRVNTKLSSLSGESKLAARQRVIRVQNRLLASFILSFLLTAWTGSYWMAFVTGFLLFLNMNCSHNFFHQRDNWRMYGFDLGLLSSYEWRVTHALSHHGFTNSVLDFEMSDFEPWFDFRVYRKSLIQRFLPAFFIFTISQFYFFSEVVKRIIVIAIGKQKLRWENLLPVAELAALYVLTDKTSSSSAFLLWLTMQATASYAFGWVGITAAHHHPDLYHSGDGQHRFGTDWGLAQLDAVRDRNDVNGNLLAELTMYGNHILHHLFPTLDHGLLDTVRPIYEKTAAEFGLPDELVHSPVPKGQWHYVLGMFGQLGRVEPRSSPASRPQSRRRTDSNENNLNNDSEIKKID